MVRNKWIYVFLGMLVFICLGTIYSWSIFRKPLENLLGLKSVESGLPFMIFLAFYALLMPVGGRLLTVFHPRLIMIAGGILVGLGWILSSYARDIRFLTFTYGVIAGSGVGIVYGVPISVVSKWFSERKGLALGLLLTGFGLSPFITAPLAKKMIDMLGVMQTFRIFGIFFLIAIVLLSIPFKFPSRTEENNMQIDDGSISTRDMMKTSKFYGLWFCFMLGTLVGLMAIGISGPVGEEIIKIDSKKVALFVSFFSVFNGIGRPLFGWMTDFIKPLYTIIISYILIFFAAILMIFYKEGTVILYAVSFAAFWLTFGGWLAIAPSLTAKIFGNKYYSQNYGIIFTAYGVGAILGNLLSGILKDTFGSYKFISYPIISLSIIGIVIAFTLLRNISNAKN